MTTKTDDPLQGYHEWYYNSEVWMQTEFLGVPCLKSVSDMWNYQEIISGIRPSLVVEFGTRHGGAALFFSIIGRAVNPDLRVLSVDISHYEVNDRVRQESSIELMACSSLDQRVVERIRELRSLNPGPLFLILDSDHRKEHVLAEMESIRPAMEAGDYLVVEDGNINGHPVLPGWGEGPYEAIQAYRAKYPDDYRVDLDREVKFGFTFSPGGFLQKT